MKAIIILLFISASICSAQNAKTQIIGSWKTADLEEGLSELKFGEENFMSLTLNGEIMDGKNYVVKGGKNDGTKGLIKYEIDENVVPVTLDIVGYTLVDGMPIEVGRMLGIIEFLSSNELKINLSFSGPREKEFSGYNADSTQILYRKIEH